MARDRVTSRHVRGIVMSRAARIVMCESRPIYMPVQKGLNASLCLRDAEVPQICWSVYIGIKPWALSVLGIITLMRSRAHFRIGFHPRRDLVLVDAARQAEARNCAVQTN